MLHLNVAQPASNRMDGSVFEKSMRNINHSFNNISSLLLQRCNNQNQNQSLKEDFQLQINEPESQARLRLCRSICRPMLRLRADRPRPPCLSY